MGDALDGWLTNRKWIDNYSHSHSQPASQPGSQGQPKPQPVTCKTTAMKPLQRAAASQSHSQPASRCKENRNSKTIYIKTVGFWNILTCARCQCFPCPRHIRYETTIHPLDVDICFQVMFNISAFASFHVQHICIYTFSFKLCLTDLHLHVFMFNTSAIARCHVEHVCICTFSCLTYLDLNVFNSALTRFHG